MVLSRCFPSTATAGYTHMADRQVISVNGHPVLNLRHMYALVHQLHATSDFIAFEVYCTGGNAIVTTRTSTSDETRALTMSLYRIPAPAAQELQRLTPEELAAALASGAAAATPVAGSADGRGAANAAAVASAGVPTAPWPRARGHAGLSFA